MRKLTEQEIRDAYTTLGFEHDYFCFFYEKVKKMYEELEQDEPDNEKLPEEESNFDISIRLAASELAIYAKERSLGHGDLWARAYTEFASYGDDDEDRCIVSAYHAIEEQTFADQELELHLKCANKDELYIEHYKYLINVGEINVSQHAQDYCDAYKGAINNGKTDLYAKIFAQMIDYDYNESYSEKYADKYVELIEKGFNEGLAKSLADEYASGYADHGEREDPDIPEYWEEKINGEIKAWEYIKELNLDHRFVDIYVKNYVDIKLADKPELVPWNRVDDFILEVALAEYNGKPIDISHLFEPFKQNIKRETTKQSNLDFDKEAELKDMFPNEDDLDEAIGDFMGKL